MLLRLLNLWSTSLPRGQRGGFHLFGGSFPPTVRALSGALPALSLACSQSPFLLAPRMGTHVHFLTKHLISLLSDLMDAYHTTTPFLYTRKQGSDSARIACTGPPREMIGAAGPASSCCFLPLSSRVGAGIFDTAAFCLGPQVPDSSLLILAGICPDCLLVGRLQEFGRQQYPSRRFPSLSHPKQDPK